MPSESQLKAQMKAAIAKKKLQKNSSAIVATKKDSSPVSEVSDDKSINNDTSTLVSKSAQNTSTASVTNESVTDVPEFTPRRKKPSDDSVANEAEFVRNFFSRPIRVGVLKKQVYFCVPDVLETSNNPEKQLKYSELIEVDDAKKIINPLVITMWFANLGGGNEKLDAAKANDLITIINELKISFPSPIEKWLTDTSNRLMTVLA